MSGELHRHAFGNSATNHIAHRRAPEVVWNAARAASYRARGGPCLIERANPTSFLRTSASLGNHSEEDPRHKLVMYANSMTGWSSRTSLSSAEMIESAPHSSAYSEVIA